MYIHAQTIVLFGGVIGVLTTLITLLWKLFKAANHQKEQDKKIKCLRATHEKDTTAIQEEQTLIVYGLLACLKGLSEQGCNGPVSKAIDKLEKHLNQKAHHIKEKQDDNND